MHIQHQNYTKHALLG